MSKWCDLMQNLTLRTFLVVSLRTSEDVLWFLGEVPIASVPDSTSLATFVCLQIEIEYLHFQYQNTDEQSFLHSVNTSCL